MHGLHYAVIQAWNLSLACRQMLTPASGIFFHPASLYSECRLTSTDVVYCLADKTRHHHQQPAATMQQRASRIQMQNGPKPSTARFVAGPIW